MSEELVLWHDFNVALVTAAAGLLGLLFVAPSIHIRALSATRNAELRSVARTVFLGYVVSLTFGFLALMPQTLSAFGVELIFLNLAATLPFAAAARSGLRATGVGYDRRVTVVQFRAGFGRFAFVASRNAVSGEGPRRRSSNGGDFVYRSTIRPVRHPPSACRSKRLPLAERW